MGNSQICDFRFEILELALKLSHTSLRRIRSNYIVRAQTLFLDSTILCYVRRQQGSFGGYGAYYNQFSSDWDTSSCGIGKQAVGKPWQDIARTKQRLTEEVPQEFAVSAYGNEIAVYVNGKRMVSINDGDSADGGISFYITKDNRQAILRDLQVCNLDGTDLTPDDVFPQKEDPEAAKLLSPQYLTDELRKQNLLSNAGFEFDGSAWSFESWRNDAKVLQFVDVPTRSGSKAAQLKYSLNDAASCRQSVKVKPHKRYLLSGWIRTKDLKYEERDRRGADLFVPGSYFYRSPDLHSTDDWTYYAVVVPSGNRTTMEVGFRLGLNSGTVSGTAWFDDLCLIELPD